METFIKNYKVQHINIVHQNSSILNKKIAKIFVINLYADTLKRNYIVTLFQKLRINYTLVIVNKIEKDAYDFIQKYSAISENEAGCLLSHLWCLNYIISKSLKNAIIFEDDIILHKDFERMLCAKLNLNFDFLLLGACDFNFSICNKEGLTNSGYYYPKTFHYLLGAHANYYSLEGAKYMYQLKTNYISFFDNFYGDVFLKFPESSGVCYPNLVISDISSSSLNHQYHFFSDAEKDYYTKCFTTLNFKDYHVIYIQLLNKFIKSNHVEKFKSFKDALTYCVNNVFEEKEKVEAILERSSQDFFDLHDLYSILLEV